VQDYDERMPSHGNWGVVGLHWSEQIYPYVKNPQVFGCPSAASASPVTEDDIDAYFNYSWNYYGNGALRWLKLAQIWRPAEAIIMLDNDYYIANPWRNDNNPWNNDSSTDAIENNGVPRHNEGANIGFVDGHGKWLKPTNYLEVRMWDWRLQ